jgi:hypothetical protein
LVIPTDVVPSQTWLYSFLPLIIVGVVVLGFIFLIVLGLLIGRRVTMTMMTGGAIALTLASIILLSGLWCMLLSPTMIQSDTKDSFYRELSIGGLESWSYSVNVRVEDTLMIHADGIRAYNDSVKIFNVYVYDPDGEIFWSETNTTYAHFSMKALKSGLYRIEVQNPNQNIVDCYIQFTVSAKVTYRPLEPLGQWLSLISLPIFGLGMWASGLFAIMRKHGYSEQQNQ